jgi:hypothetical protein
LIFETNTCVLQASSALSSGVFRQEIAFSSKLSTAGSYLLRQGLFYPVLFFIGMGSPAKGPFAIRNKPGWQL